MQKRLRPATLAVPALLTSLLLAACGGPTPATTATTTSPATGAASASELKEVASVTPRVLLSHDRGVTVLDSATGDVISEIDRPGFLRLAGAGDGRHALIADGDRFLALDAAVQTRLHGDHTHSYAGDPSLTDISYDSPHAGHVVVNDGLTALFSDGEGTVRIIPTDQVAGGYRAADGTVVDTGAPHHGVAVPFRDGSVLLTVGTEDERRTIQHRAADGTVLAETDQCPGVHGEATAAAGRAVFGCEDGPVVFDGTEFHKIPAAHGADYQRTGNVAGHPDSPTVLGDLKVDKDAKKERPTRVTLIDTRSNTMQQVELDSSYWFRSLSRGPAGEALVLTYDGHLKVIDPGSGEITADIPAIEAWEEKEKWQEPGPIIQVVGDTAYITDAENKELVLVDLTSGEVRNRFQLTFAPVEMTVLDGIADADAAQIAGKPGHEGHGDHDH